MAKKETHAEVAATTGRATLDEYSDGGIQKVSESDVIGEEFMNDLLEIMVSKDGTPGSYDVITPNVNGINQPIIRGRIQKVKRKYVEALARSRITTYEQLTPDPTNPEKFEMREVTVLTYPFSVLDDPHPKGREWLQNIIAQP